jgi:hypothetical protein
LNVKREVLRLLREDEEFRYAVAGIIGLHEILKRFDKHDELFHEVFERFDKHDELFKEIFKRFDQHDKLFDEVFNRFAKHDELFVEVFKRLDRHEEELVEHRMELARHGEELVRLRRDMLEGFRLMDRHISALGARWGLMAEEAFREGLRGFLEKELNVRVERWTEFDHEGRVYGYPSMVEIDVSISDQKTTLMEVASHIKRSDVLLFVRKARFYEEYVGRKPYRLRS